MTPLEKAKELINKFCKDKIICICRVSYSGGNPDYSSLIVNEAKQCALIAVDEIINNLLSLFDKGIKDVHISLDSPKQTHRDVIYPEVNYWKEVKNEIEHL